jgi:membrane fusion protein, multidrug efflux system
MRFSLALSRSLFKRAATALTLSSLVVLAACSRTEPAADPVRSVKLVTLAPASLHLTTTYAGEIRARTESRLSLRVGGKLIARPVEVGQSVRTGDLLAQVDPQDFVLAAQAAQAQVSAATTQRDLAQSNLRRFESLRQQGFISNAELEARTASLQSAEAALRQAQAQASAQANQATYARLLATAAGVITSTDAEVGQVVSAGQPLVRLAHDGPRDAVFAVSEGDVLRLQAGQTMQVSVSSTGQTLSGRVREIAASADPATRTYAVKLALDAQAALPLGATVNVKASDAASAETVLKLPTSALRQDGQGSAVWVFDAVSGSVKSQTVTLGPVDGNEVVITAGLSAGQRVVAAGVHVLAEGQKVTVYSPPGTPSTAAAQ